MESGMKQKSQMWGAVCGKTARTVLRGVSIPYLLKYRKEWEKIYSWLEQILYIFLELY